VRSYTGQRPDRDTVQALLDAAVQAPTAMHAEPWAFAIVQNAAMLKRISDAAKAQWLATLGPERELHATGEAAMRSHFAQELANPDFSVFYDAGTLIVICAKPGPFSTADCWLAAENLMLAASALGLGTCCIGSAVGALNTPEIKGALGIPADVTAVAPIIVGVPRQAPGPDARRSPEILGWLHA
jgi:nitroreductase